MFGNLMVDVEATNAKLIQRQTNIVVEATGVSAEQAEAALAACGRHCKTAILMILGGFSAEQAAQKLAQHQALSAQRSTKNKQQREGADDGQNNPNHDGTSAVSGGRQW
uniref:hypothetical protein n=1 Tax=Vibrio cholerae TaxID=666 RepID=UPI003F5834C2